MKLDFGPGEEGKMINVYYNKDDKNEDDRQRTSKAHWIERLAS